MLVRVAAYAGWFFAFSLGAVAMAQETAQLPALAVLDQNIDTQRKTQVAPRQGAHIAALSTGTEPALAKRAISSQTAPTPETAPFGLATEGVSQGEILRKWASVESGIREDEQILARCREDASSCPLAAQRLLAIVDEGRARSGRARIGVINRAINLAIIPTSDLVQWGVVDRWSAPLETFTTNRGDCEDYAIAKYVALRAAGVAPDDVKLVVVRNDDISENHAVVAVRLDGAWVTLDNRWMALVPDRAMRHATPTFEIGEDGVRRFVAPLANPKLRQARDGAPVSSSAPYRP